MSEQHSNGSTDLVTGASGFIGRHLARRLLREGRSVKLLCRKGSEKKLPPDLRENSQIEIAPGDLRDRESLKQAVHGVAHVYHCAGNVSDWGTEDDFQAINVRGTDWLLQAALKNQVSRFIHLSSIAAFGTPSPGYFDDASSYGKSRDPYSRTKAQAEQLVFDFHKTTGLPVTVLRPAVVYGLDGTWFEEPMRMIEKGKMFLLGGGSGTCHPCYIENLVDAMWLVARDERAIGRGYIIADDDPISFREYFNSLAWIAGKPPIRRSIPLPMAHAIASACELGAKTLRSKNRPLLTHTAVQMVTTRSRMSMHRIQEDLGWKPRYSFKAAIEELRGQYHARSQGQGTASP
ncbi:MAG: SDR family NAD(P)-dependent oxidoreductase [Oligoflexia bacterium]|nr:SDR family NAD(P)-dependent oxidoreductase [Oligoflexia bacterium]